MLLLTAMHSTTSTKMRIVPEGEQNTGLSAPASLFRRATLLLNQVDHKWSDIQVGRQGKYSIERLESFDYYCRTTSKARVLLVCVLTPLPALVLIVLLECLPLRPPSDGWAANGVFWFRVSFATSVINLVAMSGLKKLVPGLDFTSAKVFIVTAGTGIWFAAFWIAVAVIVGFPVPFLWQLGFVPNSIAMGAMLIFTLGKAPFKRDSPLRPLLLRFHDYFASHGVLATLYYLLKVLYDYVPAEYQGLATLLMTILTFGVKKVTVHILRDYEDFVPETVAFSVDFFSTLFVSVCMFNSTSISVAIFVIAVDVLQSMLEFREVRINASTLSQLIQELRGHRNHSRHDLVADRGSNDLVALVLAVCRDPSVYQLTSLPEVRLWACLPHPLENDRLQKMKTLEASSVYSSRCLSSTRTVSISRRNLQHCGQRSRVLRAILNTTADPAKQNSKNALTFGAVVGRGPLLQERVIFSHGVKETKKLVVQSLQLLFHCEYLTLVEYVECVIPLVFVMYKTALHALPNVIYFPGGASSWTITALRDILLFSALEVVSLVALSILLQRKFAFSPLYQLAFTLETQFVMVQAVLLFATFSLLPYELEHLGANAVFSACSSRYCEQSNDLVISLPVNCVGADFTLRFVWLHDKGRVMVVNHSRIDAHKVVAAEYHFSSIYAILIYVVFINSSKQEPPEEEEVVILNFVLVCRPSFEAK